MRPQARISEPASTSPRRAREGRLSRSRSAGVSVRPPQRRTGTPTSGTSAVRCRSSSPVQVKATTVTNPQRNRSRPRPVDRRPSGAARTDSPPEEGSARRRTARPASAEQGRIPGRPDRRRDEQCEKDDHGRSAVVDAEELPRREPQKRECQVATDGGRGAVEKLVEGLPAHEEDKSDSEPPLSSASRRPSRARVGFEERRWSPRKRSAPACSSAKTLQPSTQPMAESSAATGPSPGTCPTGNSRPKSRTRRERSPPTAAPAFVAARETIASRSPTSAAHEGRESRQRFRAALDPAGRTTPRIRRR